MVDVDIGQDQDLPQNLNLIP